MLHDSRCCGNFMVSEGMNQPTKNETNMKIENLSEIEALYLAKKVGKKVNRFCPIFRSLFHRGVVTTESRYRGCYLIIATVQTVANAQNL